MPLLTQASEAVDPQVIFRQPSWRAAIRLAANVSGLEEKQIYGPLGIDASYWTRIMNGQANFPDEKLEKFMDLVDNEIPLQWLANRRGKGLHMLESEAARQLRITQEALAEERKKTQLLTEVLKNR